MDRNTATRLLAYMEAASDKHGDDGTCEIDTLPPLSELPRRVSEGDDAGAYVQAWVWVYDDDVEPRHIVEADKGFACLQGQAWPPNPKPTVYGLLVEDTECDAEAHTFDSAEERDAFAADVVNDQERNSDEEWSDVTGSTVWAWYENREDSNSSEDYWLKTFEHVVGGGAQ